jgi:hypothetical protein
MPLWQLDYVTLAALRFFYTVTLERPRAVEDIPTSPTAKRLPFVLSQNEVARFLGAVDKSRSDAPVEGSDYGVQRRSPGAQVSRQGMAFGC